SFSPQTDDGRIIWTSKNGPTRQRWCLFVGALMLISPLFLPTQAQPSGGPALSVSIAVDRTVRLTWPAAATAFVLEETDSLDSLSPWRAVAETAQVQGNQFSLLIAPAGKTRFFRLRQAQSVSSFQVARHTP